MPPNAAPPNEPNAYDARSNDDTRNTPAAPAHRTHHHRDHPPRLTAGDYRPLRQYTPRANRTNTRPREFTVTRPARFDSDTPEPDTFNHWPRPVGTRRLNCSPIPAVSTDWHRRQEADVPTSSPRLCPGCRRTVRGRCPHCTPASRTVTDRHRGSSTSRGYGSHWRRVIRPAYLREHPLCCLCGALAEVPDHWPETRASLVARGVEDPDAPHRLRPLCLGCHARYGARD